jgi:hypothetical protein
MTHRRALIAATVGLVTVGLAVGTLRAAPAQARGRTRARATPAAAAAPAPASVVTIPEPMPRVTRALSIPSPVCTVAGWLSGLAGTLCSVARKGGELLSAGGKLAGSAGSVAKVVSVAAVLAGLTVWVTGAGRAVLGETAKVIGASTRPQLESSWFSSSYWRMAAIGMLLTLPFLFAACVQGLLRSDPSLIGRAALGYLPLAVLGISIAAPLTTLFLSASDGLSTLIAAAAGEAPGVALAKLGVGTVLLAGASRSTFIAFVIGFVTVAATLTLWVELLIRAAAVYVIVLMLPVVFAALVWPARRVWAIRSVETLVALILAKFAIVAVLSLGGAAIGHDINPGPAGALVGVTLVMLAAFSPWALLRLLPLHEMAAGVEGLGPQLSRRGPMFDRPVPQAAGERATSPDPPPDDRTIDAAQMAVEGLNGDRHGASAGEILDGSTAGGDGGLTASGDEGPVGSGDEPETTVPEDRVASAAGGAGSCGPTGIPGPAGVPGAAEARGAPAASQPEAAEGARERLPGMEPRWQMENDSWPTHVLGPASPTEDTLASERAPQAPPEIPEATMPPDAPHPLRPVDPPRNPDAGDR